MIQLNTNLKVMDNSGAKIARCIKVLKNTQYAYTGDIIVVSIRKAIPNKKIKAGEVYKALIIYTKKSTQRLNGSYFKLASNAVILLNTKELPQATRISGPVPRDLKFRAKNFKQVLSIAKKTI
jgi:large subunit ribosomal protein L14